MNPGISIRRSFRSLLAAVLVAFTLFSGTEGRAQVAADSARSYREAGKAARDKETSDGFRRAIQLWRQALGHLERLPGTEREAAEVHRDIGAAFLNLQILDSAAVSLNAALEIQMRFRADSSVARTLHYVARIHRERSELQPALALYRRSLVLGDLHNQEYRAQLYNDLATVHNDLGNRDSARHYLAASLGTLGPNGDALERATSLQNWAIIEAETGDRERGLALFDSARVILGDTDRGLRASILAQEALILTRWGQIDSALVLLREAKYLADSVGSAEYAAVVQNAYGNVYVSRGDLDSARVAYQRAISGFTLAGDPLNAAEADISLGQLYRMFGQEDSLQAATLRMLETARSTGRLGTEATARNTLGGIKGRAGDYAGARAEFEAAAIIQQRIGDRGGAAVSRANIGIVFLREQRVDTALTILRGSLKDLEAVGNYSAAAAAVNDIGLTFWESGAADSTEFYFRLALAFARKAQDMETVAAGLQNLAGLFYNLDRHGDAIAFYDSAAAVVSSMGTRAGEDRFQVGWNDSYADLFDQWALVLYLEQQAAASLAATERGRTRALLHLMRADTPVTSTSGDMRAEGHQLLDRATAGQSTAIVYLATPELLLTWVSRPNGPRAAIHQRLSRDSLNDLVYQVRRYTAEVEDLDRCETIGDIRSEAKLQEALRNLAAALFPEDLLEELPPGGELLIIPDGPLASVPFAALPLPGGRLGLRYALHYGPSLAAVAEARDRPVPASGSGALVVGNPTMPRVTCGLASSFVLNSLPNSGAAAAKLAQNLQVPLLTGDDATEPAVLNRLPTAAIVHLATHGYAYSAPERTRASWVALAPGDGENGLLTVDEVLRKASLIADLVVLAACASGLGDPSRAEGTIGLQRAFLARGARSVLVSLWVVDESATLMLLDRFYQEWRQGQGTTKAEALRRAQEWVSSQPGWEHPRFWAAFQLVGAP